MKLVLDNNILFSIMNPESFASYLFSSINAEFFAPEFIKSELVKYKEECLLKSKLSEHEFEIRQAEIEESITFLMLEEYEDFLIRSINSLEDPKDAPYLAAALSIKASIWSNDFHLKEQAIIPILTTENLLELFIKGEI